MDVAYPVKQHRIPNDQLIWSLRSITTHLPVDRVFLAGGTSKKFDPDTVVHLPTRPDDKWVSIFANLRAVLESDISEDFVWMNDDFFVLRPMKTVALHNRGPISRYLRYQERGTTFQKGMASQAAILIGWGYPDDTPNTDMHVPIVLNKTRLKHVLDRVADEHPKHPLGHFRMLYGADLPSEYLPDPKATTVGRPIPSDWAFVSTKPKAWNGAVGRELRALFPHPSPYERI